MCGLGRWRGTLKDSKAVAERMAKALCHRGSDAYGIRSWLGITLVYTAFSASSSLCLAPPRLERILGNSPNASFFHWVIWTGWTPYSAASSLSVRSPRIA
jgi:asparagine synthetase B (glutamine-hydrolysing)